MWKGGLLTTDPHNVWLVGNHHHKTLPTKTCLDKTKVPNTQPTVFGSFRTRTWEIPHFFAAGSYTQDHSIPFSTGNQVTQTACHAETGLCRKEKSCHMWHIRYTTVTSCKYLLYCNVVLNLPCIDPVGVIFCIFQHSENMLLKCPEGFSICYLLGWVFLWQIVYYLNIIWPNKHVQNNSTSFNAIWLVVSTHLKNISQIGNLPQIVVKRKNIWNHHLAIFQRHVSRSNFSFFFGEGAGSSGLLCHWGFSSFYTRLKNLEDHPI